MIEPLVSVISTFFNFEEHVYECLDNIFYQETDFLVEVIIHDDASTDNTQDLIKQYLKEKVISKKFVVKTIFQSVNKYKTLNILSDLCFPLCNGKYIALIDGDDYWTDPHKLQKQVSFLEANSTYSVCFHNVNLLYEDKTTRPFRNYKGITHFTTKDLLSDWIVPTCSMVFRNYFLDNKISFSEHDKLVASGDLNLLLKLSLLGDLKLIDVVMGVYRKHAGGITTARSGSAIQFIGLGYLYHYFNHISNGRFHDDVIEGFDKKASTFYSNRFLKELRGEFEKKPVDYSFNTIHKVLGVKKVFSLFVYSFKKKILELLWK